MGEPVAGRDAGLDPADQLTSHILGRVRVALLVVGLLAAGCAGSAADGPPGIVHGGIVAVGGPPGTPGHSIAGMIVVSASGRRVASQDVGEGGEFRFSLKPGRYLLNVAVSGVPCEEAEVTVEPSSDQQRDLVCHIK